MRPKNNPSLSVFLFLPLFLVCSSLLPVDDAVAQERLPRILLGEETDDFPSVGIVGSARRGGFCTGTLISPTHVLTAAHCAEVIEGASNGTFELNGEIYGTSAIFIHPDYNSFTLGNDLAILQLNEPVLAVEPSQIFRDPPLVGDLLFIVGFGATGTADDGSDGTFGTKRVGITTIDEVTRDLVSWTFDDESESNTAAGDSGGPGYIDIGGDLFVACVTSGGTEPDSVLGDFAFNTRVDAFADWIDLTIAVSEQPPSSDEPTDPDQASTDGDEGFWSKPFPFLQFLIDFLKQLLEFLTESINTPQGIEAVESPVETPTEITEPSTETSAQDPTTTSDNPVDCPVQDPDASTDPQDESPAEDEAIIDSVAEPVSAPTSDETIVTVPTGEPPAGGPVSGGDVASSGGSGSATQPGATAGGGAAAANPTSASVLDSWRRAIRLRTRSRAQANYERLILAGTENGE